MLWLKKPPNDLVCLVDDTFKVIIFSYSLALVQQERFVNHQNNTCICSIQPPQSAKHYGPKRCRGGQRYSVMGGNFEYIKRGRGTKMQSTRVASGNFTTKEYSPPTPLISLDFSVCQNNPNI